MEDRKRGAQIWEVALGMDVRDIRTSLQDDAEDGDDLDGCEISNSG